MRKEFLKFLKTGYSILMRNQKKAKLHYHYNNSQALYVRRLQKIPG